MLLDDEGATLFEYGIIAFFISIVAVALLTTIGSRLLEMFELVLNAFPG